jgi:hypothetical protein
MELIEDEAFDVEFHLGKAQKMKALQANGSDVAHIMADIKKIVGWVSDGNSKMKDT